MNPKEEQNNSEITNLEPESSEEMQKDVNYIKTNTGDNNLIQYLRSLLFGMMKNNPINNIDIK